jgi:hypothetical protein
LGTLAAIIGSQAIAQRPSSPELALLTVRILAAQQAKSLCQMAQTQFAGVVAFPEHSPLALAPSLLLMA